MAVKQIPNLPIAISLNGTEQLEAVQNGVSMRVTSAQISTLLTGGGSSVVVTQKQLRLWASANVVIVTIDNAVSADISNTVAIYWNHGNTMTINDPLYSFIQSTLGYTSAQMLSAFYNMQTYPA